jgi:NAD(P)-dependent dehydrogenase (short-subunit alcohol dehydrogenase family)
MNSLNNKVIVVTGGNGLLGREILNYLRSKGAITINAEIHEIENFNHGFMHCDITNEKSIKSLIEQILYKFGRIDGWVNNAYPRTKDWNNLFENISLKSWKKNMDIQLNSMFFCCQQVLLEMTKQKSGSIVNMSSIYGIVGPDFTVYNETNLTMPAAYSAIKGGVINFSRYLSSYYGHLGIRVNCVSPGGVFNNQNEKFVKQYEQKVPLRRMASPHEIAPAVSFLLSDEASYITGHNLIVDGGWTAI